MDVSIVIPLFNEEESLRELHAWIVQVVTANHLTYEIIFIDDGSTDHSWQIIQDISASDAHVHAFQFQRNYGKSAALHVAFSVVEGDVVVTMDADLQDSPDEIPALVKMIRDDNYDLVSGWKKKRNDPLSKTLPTKLYNLATRCMSGIPLHDFNCGLKAYKKDVIKNIEVYGEMHRYIPVIAKREGFHRIGEKEVVHHARKYGRSKFGFERFINGSLDLLTITFISRFGKKPMHFFGTIGMVMFFIGLCAFGWVGGYKLLSIIRHDPAKNIADQSVFYIALTAMIMGTQLFLAGFIGELAARNSSTRNEYKIKNKI